MLKPDYLEHVSDRMVELYTQVGADILADMARRINAYDFWIPAAEHQAKMLEEMGMVRSEITERMASMTGRTEKELRQLMKEAGTVALKSDDEVYKRAGLSPPPLAASAALQKALNAGLKRTNATFKNLTKTTANTATKQFENALDCAWLQVSSGAFDRNAAVRMVIKDLSKQGVGAIHYPSGHVDSLEVAVTRAARTGVNQTCLQLQDARADEMGCDLVETTAHGGARPEHAAWQGQIFSRSGKHPKHKDFRSVTGYGTGAGLGGWNCRHSFFPYFEGMPRAHSKEQLVDYEAKNYEYNGQKMTEYEATQQQRYIERQIRRWKRENLAMEAAGLDTAESATKISHWQQVQKDYLKQTGLKRQAGREQIAGYGKKQAGKTKSDTNKQYKEMSKLIGKEKMPEKVEDFSKLGYNSSEYKAIKHAVETAKQAQWEQSLLKTSDTTYKSFALAEDFPAWLKNQGDNWNGIEKEALIYYTGHEYTKINRFLRGRETAGEKIQEKIRYISSAIQKSEIKENITVWRGTHFKNFQNGDWLRSIPLEKWEGLQLSDVAFASTSLVKDHAFNAEVLLKINIPNGSKGAYLGDVSQFKHEKELLLEKGSVYRIVKAEEKDGKYFIEVEYGGVK